MEKENELGGRSGNLDSFLVNFNFILGLWKIKIVLLHLAEWQPSGGGHRGNKLEGYREMGFPTFSICVRFGEDAGSSAPRRGGAVPARSRLLPGATVPSGDSHGLTLHSMSSR